VPAASTEQPEPEPAPEPAPDPEPDPQPAPPVTEPAPEPGITIRWLGDAGATDDAPEIDDATLLAALPKRARMQLEEDGAIRPEFWTRLDADGTLFLTHVRWGAVESSILVVTAQAKVRSVLTLRDRVPDVGVVDVVGDERQEIVVESIDGTALSDYPKVWKVYRLDARGRLEALATMARSHGQGSKCVRYFFRNRITVPEKGVLRVQNIEFDEPGESPPQNAPKSAGETHELRWSAKAGKFQRARLPASALDPDPDPCPRDAAPPGLGFDF
jgi:hypothetical protein